MKRDDRQQGGRDGRMDGQVDWMKGVQLSGWHGHGYGLAG